MQGTHHVFDDLILAVLSLDFEQVVAEVEKVKATLLSQQHDDGAAGPVQPVPKALPGRQGTHDTQVVSIKVGTNQTAATISNNHFHANIFQKM